MYVKKKKKKCTKQNIDTYVTLNNAISKTIFNKVYSERKQT